MTKERAATFQRLLAVPVGQIDDEQLRDIMGRLRDEFDGQIPANHRQLCRIIDGA